MFISMSDDYLFFFFVNSNILSLNSNFDISYQPACKMYILMNGDYLDKNMTFIENNNVILKTKILMCPVLVLV